MIRVARNKKPDVLAKKETNWKTTIREASTDAARKKAQEKYQHVDIKDRLVEMFHGKCAYCESAITHIDYGHIEHFKPKSTPTYHELAVEWNNLLLACGRCSGAENKGSKFPLENEDGPLINPVDEEPSHHFSFDFDLKLRLANVLGVSKRGETTRIILGLNRPELVKRRSDFVKKLWVIAGRYNEDDDARAIVDSATDSKEEYAAFARSLKRFIESNVVAC